MSRYEAKKRDGLARISTFEDGDRGLSLPAAVETEILFPDLAARAFSNVPLAADPSFVRRYLAVGAGQPVAIHPAAENTASSGDAVMAADWHTALQNPRNYVEWLVALKEQVVPDTAWYAPAAALPSTAAILIYSGFDLFDFTGVDLATARGVFCTPEGEFPASAMEEGLCGCVGCREGDLKQHNRLALEREIALVRRFIEAGQLRELMEMRCRLDANQVGILRFLDRNYAFMERHLPIARDITMRANSAESQNRPEVRRYAERVIERFIPTRTDVAVLLPCSARKPYCLSQSHKKFIAAVANRGHELIVTSPLGLVPRELERVYPAGHYDVPVTGYWDREECAFIADILARYLAKHAYRRVIAHLEGGALTVAEMAAETLGIELEVTCSDRPTSAPSLRALDAALQGERRILPDMVRGTISWQFGTDMDMRGLRVRSKGPQVSVLKGKQQFFSLDPGTGLFRPTFEGWQLIPEGYRVAIDNFVPQGDVLAPGVTDADPAIREGDEVLIVGESALATGRAMMSAGEMLRSKRGVAVKARKVRKLE
ncbi:pseudouridine synthase [Methanoculleus taiwanensis]|uniref:Pseudouridine synthase n=1 Tax=Methanoculleus taiwanensis TaxID=1550565 RepID=A0A498GXF8_9EURY|nr:archaeosine synthase subunit alpha [Methanoculleus taiwanensis]RXE55233.1 pseudouridine synthase [Methanoculleus taiwanensis]